MMNRSTMCVSLVLSALVALTGCEEKKAPEPVAETPEPVVTTPPVKDSPAPGATEAKSAKIKVDPGDEGGAPVTMAVAKVYPTKGHQVRGSVTFEQVEGGLKIASTFEGLPKGKHAYHIHLLGDCTGEDGKSAGTHFNFAGSSKSPPADIKRITGDLGEVEAGEDGKASAEALIKGASLQGPYSILGRAVIVHEKGNDHAHPPIGAAGGRLGCGVIGMTEAK